MFWILLAELLRSWRAAIRRPGFVGVASVTLALGLSATLTVYTLIDSVVLRPLPYPRPANLLVIGIRHAPSLVGISPKAYQSLGELPQIAGKGLVTQYRNSFNISGGNKPDLIPGVSADRGFLATLQPAMALGRNFAPEEDRPNGARAVIVSYGFWLRHFAGDPAVIGRTILIEGTATPIVGVLPREFRFIGDPDLLLPLSLEPNSENASPDYFAVARLVDGATRGTVHPMIATLLRSTLKQQSAPAELERIRSLELGAYPLRLLIDGESPHVLRLFLASGLCVLLIALVNLANLMLLRTVSKSHENAVRAALGAHGIRLALPALAESLLIAIVGSMLGLLIARVGLSIANNAFPSEWMAGTGAISLSPLSYLLAFALGLSGMLLSTFFGLRRGSIANSSTELTAGSRTGLSRGASAFTRLLVLAQLVIAVVLLCTAASLGKALYHLMNVDLGIKPDHVLTFEISPVRAAHADAQAALGLLDRIGRRVGQIPGVETVGMGTNFPLSTQLTADVTVGDATPLEAQLKLITPGYFETFSVPIRKGRDVAKGDTSSTEPVVLINESYADHFFRGDPVGQTVSMLRRRSERVSFRVIGVVGDVRTFGPQSPSPPTVYLPLAQQPLDFINRMRGFIPFRLALRVKGDPLSYVEPVSLAVAEIDPSQPIANVLPASRMVQGLLSETRLNLGIVGVFASLALILASVGLYAIMSVAVSTRTREFGVRMALGANRMDILRLVLSGGLRHVGIGLAGGVLVTLAASKGLDRFLFGVSAVDPVSLVLVATILGLAATVACIVPAARGAMLHPMVALRTE